MGNGQISVFQILSLLFEFTEPIRIKINPPLNLCPRSGAESPVKILFFYLFAEHQKKPVIVFLMKVQAMLVVAAVKEKMQIDLFRFGPYLSVPDGVKKTTGIVASIPVPSQISKPGQTVFGSPNMMRHQRIFLGAAFARQLAPTLAETIPDLSNLKPIVLFNHPLSLELKEQYSSSLYFNAKRNQSHVDNPNKKMRLDFFVIFDTNKYQIAL